jgi:hypothetical protein
VTGCCGHCSETSHSVKDKEFFNWLRGYQHLKKDSTLCSQLVSYNERQNYG